MATQKQADRLQKLLERLVAARGEEYDRTRNHITLHGSEKPHGRQYWLWDCYSESAEVLAENRGNTPDSQRWVTRTGQYVPLGASFEEAASELRRQISGEAADDIPHGIPDQKPGEE